MVTLLIVSCDKQEAWNDLPSLQDIQPYKLSECRKVNYKPHYRNEITKCFERELTIYNRTKEPFWVYGESLNEVHFQVLRRKTEGDPWEGIVGWCGTGCDYFKIDSGESFIATITLPVDMSHWQFCVEYDRYSQKDRICEEWSTERTPIMTMDSNKLTEQGIPGNPLGASKSKN